MNPDKNCIEDIISDIGSKLTIDNNVEKESIKLPPIIFNNNIFPQINIDNFLIISKDMHTEISHQESYTKISKIRYKNSLHHKKSIKSELTQPINFKNNGRRTIFYK